MEPKLHWVLDRAINGSIWWAASPERVEAFALNVNSALQILLISSRNHNMWRKKHHTTRLKAGFRNDMEGSSCTPKTIHEQYAHPYSRVLLVTQYPGFSIGPKREEMIKAILGIQSVISKFQKPSLRKWSYLQNLCCEMSRICARVKIIFRSEVLLSRSFWRRCSEDLGNGLSILTEKYKCLSFKVIQPDNFLISNKIKLIEN